jgi:serpin B
MRSMLSRPPRIAVAALVIGIALTACRARDTVEADARTPTSQETQLAGASVAFGLDLLRAATAWKPVDNLLVSPVSVATALALAATGAKGATRDEMLGVLHLTGPAADSALRGDAPRTLAELLRTRDPETEVTIANGLWVGKEWTLADTFATRARSAYGIDVESVDFASSSAANRINRWVRKATRDRIPEIVTETSSATTAIIIAAVYFNGRWSDPFDPDDTADDHFTTADGQRVPVKMINGERSVALRSDSASTTAWISYGNGAYDAVFVLPDSGVSVSSYVAALSDSAWARTLTPAPVEGRVILQFPRFRMEWSAGLAPLLESLGMHTAFGGDGVTPDFSPMWTDAVPRRISAVTHRTVVDVSEVGTEAAAATSVEMVAATSPPPPPQYEPRRFRVDRPFIFAIRETRTGALLFVGVVNDPTDATRGR